MKRISNKTVLGVVIDKQLKWDKHNEEQCKTISRNISLLKKAKQFVPQDTLITLYNTLVLLHFYYCSSVWHDGNNTNIDKLFKLQKRAARITTGFT